MDLDAMAKGVGLFSGALAALKQAIDMLPDNSEKAEMAAALERAEREFKLAEASTAQRLEYQLCHNHFPPEIMLSADKRHWKCPVRNVSMGSGHRLSEISVPRWCRTSLSDRVPAG